MDLPKGFQQAEDEYIIDTLLKDSLFIESIEAEYGKIKKIYADWKNDLLVYEFHDEDSKCSDLTKIIETLKSLDYTKSHKH